MFGKCALIAIWILVILALSSCAGGSLDPSQMARATVEIRDIIKSGAYEERVETEGHPVFNCQNSAPVTYVVQRSRTIDESVEVLLSAELEAGFQAAIANGKAKVAAEYGWVQTTSMTDGGGLQFTVEPRTYPLYTVAWRETWEQGSVVVRVSGIEQRIGYKFLKSARPEIVSVAYVECSARGYAKATAEAASKATTIASDAARLRPESTTGPTARPRATPAGQPSPDRAARPQPTPRKTPGSTKSTEVAARDSSNALWTNPADGAIFVYVPAGEFIMGTDIIKGWKTHTNFTDAFWIMQTEVSNSQYALCVQAAACTAPNNKRWQTRLYANYPVTDVSWHQADEYALWAGGRLPSEAEWEKACRGTDGRLFPWGSDFDYRNRANECDINCPSKFLSPHDEKVDDGYEEWSPVGSYPAGASPYGALDMVGNVWEWTRSAYAGYPYLAEDGREEHSAEGGRLARGQSYADTVPGCQIRDLLGQEHQAPTVGFRVIVPAD